MTKAMLKECCGYVVLYSMMALCCVVLWTAHIMTKAESWPFSHSPSPEPKI